MVEIAGTVTPRELERGLDDALHSNIVRLAQVRDTLMRTGRHRKGAAVLDALLAEREGGSGLTRSDGEIALSEALVASGLPGLSAMHDCTTTRSISSGASSG